MNRTEQPTLWTIDVEALERTVTVAVTHSSSPSTADVLNALDHNEREVVRKAFAAASAGETWRSGPFSRLPPPHVCVNMCAGLSCCPGCGDGCSHCIPYVVCITRAIGCVMPEAHEGPCVPSTEPRWATHEQISARAEPYRLAGIAYTITVNERNPERFRLDFVHDREVPSSGRWRRRLTRHNGTEFADWLGDSLLRPPGQRGSVRMLDSDGQGVTVWPRDIVDRSGDHRTIIRAER